MIKLLKQRLRRMGDYRIFHARYKWGFDFLDDLDKLMAPKAVRTVFDIGANRGDLTKLFLLHFPSATIHALEPVQATFDHLRMALAGEPRARLHPLAASDRTGSATIRTFEGSGSNTMVSELSDKLRTSPAGEEQIETCRLDELIPKLGINRVDLLKIDVEGFEKNVLLGCGDHLRPDAISYIFFECHRISRSSRFPSLHTMLAEIDRLLDDRGYRFITLYTEAIIQDEPIGSYNALYGPAKLEFLVSGPPTFGLTGSNS